MPGRFPGLRGQHAGIEVVPEAVRQARLDAKLSQAALGQPQYTRAAIYQVEGDKAFDTAARMFADLELPVDVLDVQAEHFAGLRVHGRTADALNLCELAIASGQAALRRVEGGWAEVVAAHWSR